MKRLRISLLSLLVLALAVLPACATSGGGAAEGSPAAADEVGVVVENNLVVPSSVSVYLITPTGSRQLLGNVSPGSTDSFRYQGPTAGGMARLLARTTGGNEIVSTPFNLTRGERVTWRLATNSVVMGG